MLPIAIAVVLVAWLALVPLGFMLWQSVLSPETAASAARFTLDNYRTAYASADTARLLANSLQFALGSAVLAFSLGTLLAWIKHRDTWSEALDLSSRDHFLSAGTLSRWAARSTAGGSGRTPLLGARCDCDADTGGGNMCTGG